MLALTEKQLGHALFYSIKSEDYEQAEYLLTLDPPLSTSYFLSQDEIAYTPNLLVGKVAQTIKKFGLWHNKTQQVIRILERFIEGKCDWKCHCSPKNPHYCAVSQALKYLPLDPNKDLLCEQNWLLLKLLTNGATYHNHGNSKEPVWLAFRELNAYIEAKQQQVIQLLKMNRHAKPLSANKNAARNRN